MRFGPPHYMELLEVKRFGDYLAVYGNADFGASERFLDVCNEEGIRGLEIVHPPVVVTRVGTRGRREGGHPVYHLVEIAREGADLDDEGSEITRSEVVCSRCRAGPIDGYQRIVLKPGSECGLDIFYALGLPGDILVSEKFVDVCLRHRISNTYFTPCEVARYWWSTGKDIFKDPLGVVIPVDPRSARVRKRARGEA